MTHPCVPIIITNYNGKEYTVKCLSSLSEIDYPNYEIIVVDNASVDGSLEEIKKKFPDITILENKKNLGYEGGNNVGIRHALGKGTEYIFLLNNDTIVDKHLLTELVKVAESDPSIGIIGPKIYFLDEPNKIWFAGGKINWKTGVPYHIGGSEEERGQFDEIREIDFTPGCALLIKRRVIETIGLLDERFFCLYGDADWNLRANRAGFRILYVPKAKLWHKVAASMVINSPLPLYYHARNRTLFMKKNTSLKIFLLFLIREVYSLIRLTLYLYFKKRETKKAQAVVKGFFHFWQGKSGEG